MIFAKTLQLVKSRVSTGAHHLWLPGQGSGVKSRGPGMSSWGMETQVVTGRTLV